MKRLEEKVKDIVEVRSAPSLTDFLANPEATLNGYHFTDITADLMAKWIGQIADVKKDNGAAYALAGFRGVGKSHFLATLGAIVSQPELRTRISDTHVMATAQRLSRRHGVVAHLRRGSSDSLLAELKIAIASVTGTTTGELSDSLNELLLTAANKSGDVPFVLLIDTAVGREARVARDDGALLSEIASAAIMHGIFVGLALDDDIAGADGLNSSIASAYSIDYLDQEHLYKIVNAFVFTKHEHKRPILIDIYEAYRQALPGFRWSEHRFSSLYPLHPAILEIAPFVRLYLHEFALLGFAVDAAIKILGRPANSLIGLDEVFDNVEPKLRNIGELRDAFAAFDSLDRTVIAKLPVMKRHEAKLILKGLFLLSFNGEGVTATDLCAAMLMIDPAGSSNVDLMLQSFADAVPAAINRSESTGRETKFGFKIGAEDNLNSTLAESVKNVSPEVVEGILRKLTAEKFADFDITDDGSSIWATCHPVWRGGIRPGDVIWQKGPATPPNAEDSSGGWKAFIKYGSTADGETARFCWPYCEWKLAELTADEMDTVRRFHAMQSDGHLREHFRDSIHTALHVHTIAVEKIWQRIFLEDSRLICGENEYRFTDAARSFNNLSQVFTTMLEGELEKQFPSHPNFAQILGTKEVAQLTEQLFSGSGSDNPEIQKLAGIFALQLGLVSDQNGVYIPLGADDLLLVPLVRQAFAPLEQNDVVAINELSAQMRRSPYGLTQESQHLVFAALAAQRKIEFVTSSGNRINHRSLDLHIDWSDIVAIAKPATELYSDARLTSWAVRLTGDQTLGALKPSDASLKLLEVLSQWLVEWQGEGLVDKFDQLPDEKVNAKVWRIASNVRKTFGVIAESIDGLLQDTVTSEQCLQTIADVFADSEEDFEGKQRDLASLREFISGSTERDAINKYLALCPPTNQPDLEALRCALMDALDEGYFDCQNDSEEFKERWARFKAAYVDLYTERHDMAMTARRDRSKLDEFLRSDQWTMFTDLSSIAWFGHYDMEQAMASIREFRYAQCDANVRELLDVQPFCNCTFDLTTAAGDDILLDDVNRTVERGLDYFKRKVLAEGPSFTRGLDIIENDGHDMHSLSNLRQIIPRLEEQKDFPRLSAQEVHALRVATQKLDRSAAIHSDRRRESSDTFAGFNPDDLRELEHGLDSLEGLGGFDL